MGGYLKNIWKDQATNVIFSEIQMSLGMQIIWAEYLPSMDLYKPDVLAYACGLSIQEVDAGGSGTEAHS